MTPPLLCVRPFGNATATMDHCAAPTLPPTDSVWLYDCPANPFGTNVVTTTGGPTTIVSVAEPLLPRLSRAWNVGVNVSDPTALPLIAPVPALGGNPGGNCPPATPRG